MELFYWVACSLGALASVWTAWVGTRAYWQYSGRPEFQVDAWYSIQVRGHVSRLPWCQFKGWDGNSSMAKWIVRELSMTSSFNNGLATEYTTERTINTKDIVEFKLNTAAPHPYNNLGPRPM